MRIIPARAGFTRAMRSSSAATEDHPRSRGVYHWGRLSVPSTRGSSPLARGLRDPVLLPVPVRGIIPARAGFTDRRAVPAPASPDHPRSRGVYHRKFFGGLLKTGSSPLARGLQTNARHQQDEQRIIPARAGFTCVSNQEEGVCRDHPRSRGVYSRCPVASGSRKGSSPLARGLPRRR